MTSINLAKGLFRVWVLLSLCWVVPATFIQFDDLTASLTGYYDPNYPGGIRPESSQPKFDFKKMSDEELEQIVNSTPISVITALILPKRVLAIEIIILPPLLLLLLGYGVLWAVRGFKE